MMCDVNLCWPSVHPAMQRARGQHRETNGHASAELVDRMTAGERVAQANIEGQVLAYLPDQSGEAGHGFRLAKLLLVEGLCDRAHRPLRRSFDDHAGEEISVMITGQLCNAVQVDGAPVPALRHNAGETGAKLGGSLAVRQQHAELGCDTGAVLLLKTALAQYAFQERAGCSETCGPSR